MQFGGVVFNSPPPAAKITIYVDAAWDPRTKRAVVAAVARDSTGAVLSSTARCFPRTETVLCAELLAIRVGDVIIESDSDMAVGEISKGDNSTYFGEG